MSHSGKTKIAGVMGWPVSHSLSPVIHGYWLEKLGIDGAYIPLAVEPVATGLSDAIKGIRALGFQGANVTIPHKVNVMDHVDTVDATATRIGAVNTLVICSDGVLQGRNTDAFGFIENLRHGAADHDLTQAPAVVIGAGGAARAVVIGLLDAGVPEVILTNRTSEKADELAQRAGDRARVVPWNQRATALSDAGLLVNTSSLGMTGQPPLDLDVTALPPTALVTDIVYAPLETPLLAAARARGNKTVDGLGMLLHQARPGFEAWFGVLPDVDDDLRAHVLAKLGQT